VLFAHRTVLVPVRWTRAAVSGGGDRPLGALSRHSTNLPNKVKLLPFSFMTSAGTGRDRGRTRPDLWRSFSADKPFRAGPWWNRLRFGNHLLAMVDGKGERLNRARNGDAFTSVRRPPKTW